MMTATKLKVSIIETLPAPGSNACGLVWDGTAFWFFDHSHHLLHKIDRSGEILLQYKIINACCDTAYDGEYLFQGAPDEHKILVIDPDNGKIVKTIPTDDKCSGLCMTPLGSYRGSWSRKQLIKFDKETGTELDSLETGASTSGIAFDGRYIWHGGEIDGNNFLFKVCPNKGLLESIPVTFTICGLTHDGEYLWAADGTHHQLVKLEIE